MNHPLWSMDAVNYDDVEWIPYPVIVQPKLNGVRAKWDSEKRLLISRQGKAWKRSLLPHIYERLEIHKTLSFDGELYNHKLSLQEINARVSINANEPHEDCEDIAFHVFDVIDHKLDTIKRQQLAEQLYSIIVPHFICANEEELMMRLNIFKSLGYEGMMIRLLGVPYRNGRTEALIKLKPWSHATATITGFIEGKGKLESSLGALKLQLENGVKCKVGGGNITEVERKHIWTNRTEYLSKKLTIRFRELSDNGIPLQPQIDKL